MDYDIVIATRNRAAALEMSLPLFARQTRRPCKIIVVDASDDPQAASRVAVRALSGIAVPYRVIGSSVRSLAHQRNLGLADVTSPVVMMPDDDSLWFDDTAERILQVYEADVAEAVGGVTGKAVQRSPLQVDDLAYGPSRAARWKAYAQPWRSHLEQFAFKQPFLAYAEELWRTAVTPPWRNTDQSRRVETVGGFRMSFRTDVIRQVRFDETLGYKSGYCQHEDMDASLRVQKAGKLLVSAEHARVFHHVFPGKRAGGFAYGFGQIANYTYICCKVIPRESPAWRLFGRYMLYKIAVYRLRRSAYWAEVAAGATFAWTNRRLLLQASPDGLADAFRSLCDRTPRQNA